MEKTEKLSLDLQSSNLSCLLPSSLPPQPVAVAVHHYVQLSLDSPLLPLVFLAVPVILSALS